MKYGLRYWCIKLYLYITHTIEEAQKGHQS